MTLYIYLKSVFSNPSFMFLLGDMLGLFYGFWISQDMHDKKCQTCKNDKTKTKIDEVL